MVQENQVEIKLNEMGHISFWIMLDDLNPLGYVSKKVGLEVKVEKTRYMFVSRHQNAGQNQDIKIANRSVQNVSQWKYSNIV
jgi:hypothetical protein